MGGDDYEGEHRRGKNWHEAAVTWGSFVLSIAAFVGALLADRLASEKRVTQIEERQAFVMKALGDLAIHDASQNKEIEQMKIDAARRDYNDGRR